MVTGTNVLFKFCYRKKWNNWRYVRRFNQKQVLEKLIFQEWVMKWLLTIEMWLNPHSKCNIENVEVGRCGCGGFCFWEIILFVIQIKVNRPCIASSLSHMECKSDIRGKEPRGLYILHYNGTVIMVIKSISCTK